MMRSLILAAAMLAAATPLAFAAEYAGGAVKTEKTSLGEVLADAKGMTLYIYDEDVPGTSNCYEKCATNWPPLIAASGAKPEGDFTLVERKDGSMQWAHKGMPLYLWVKDTKVGDTTGDGVGGVWHVVKE